MKVERKTLFTQILENSLMSPKKIAITYNSRSITYVNLVKHIKIVAARLLNLGIKRGDIILLSAVSRPEVIAAYMGIQYCGAVVVFIDSHYTLKTINSIYDETRAKLILTDKLMGSYQEKMVIYSLKEIYYSESDCLELDFIEPKGSDIAEILFTTGTTGFSKGVVHTYDSIYAIMMNTIIGTGITENDCILLPLPLSHSLALRVLRAALYKGATIVLQNGFTFVKDIENNLKKNHCTAIIVVPAAMEMLYEKLGNRFSEVLGELRYIEVGAGSLSINQREKYLNLLPNTIIYNTWGSTETGGIIFANIAEVMGKIETMGTLGKISPHLQIRVLDENGKELKSNKDNPGRMAIKGMMIMNGYWNNPDLTQKTIRDGWLITNDLVYLNEDGYLFMLGRIDDIVNVGGEKVSATEVENIICQYEEVKECACIGVDDKQGIWGEIPIAFIVQNENYEESILKKYLVTHLERYKMPHKYIYVSSLPRNYMGKIDRKTLKRIYMEKTDKRITNLVLENILGRHSTRSFQDKPIPRDELEMILKAGYHAPSGHNRQTWRFTVILSKEKILILKKQIEMSAKKRVYVEALNSTTCLILISNKINNPDGCQDSSCAAENIFLAAQSLGIGSVWINALMNLCEEKNIRDLLRSYEIPENHKVWCMVALGYPAHEGKVSIRKENVVFFVK